MVVDLEEAKVRGKGFVVARTWNSFILFHAKTRGGIVPEKRLKLTSNSSSSGQQAGIHSGNAPVKNEPSMSNSFRYRRRQKEEGSGPTNSLSDKWTFVTTWRWEGGEGERERERGRGRDGEIDRTEETHPLIRATTEVLEGRPGLPRRAAGIARR